ncbi:hypothetical protein TSUD_229510 [Trifolium subterraneum]|uniref:Complex 1 LYR protein domain-containing protein n=1 Tax=Trifolium subterraneum TaxID=3900 RepID=A0A2Z6M234_TRISU|nr:hypothetical protein TSUD_229510 [Trifolium subterraneum]
MGGTKVQRLSGMQKQVLSLYRGFLRVARSKSEEERRNIESVVKQEFRRDSKEVDRKNFQYIEYLLRRGNKQLDQLRNPDSRCVEERKGSGFSQSSRELELELVTRLDNGN